MIALREDVVSGDVLTDCPMCGQSVRLPARAVLDASASGRVPIERFLQMAMDGCGCQSAGRLALDDGLEAFRIACGGRP